MASQSSFSHPSSSSSTLPSPPSSAKLKAPQLPFRSSNFSAVPVQRLQESGAALARSKSVGTSQGQGASVPGPSSSSTAGHQTQGSNAHNIRDLPLSSPSTITTFQIPHTFNPETFKSKPPLSAMPVSPRRRIYEQHPSRNRFICGGRLVTSGGSPLLFMFSITLVCTISGVWFGDTCVWWWHNLSPAVAAVGAYMCLLTISTMLTIAFRDPGILPRNLHPIPSISPSNGGVRMPRTRDLKVRGHPVQVNYCAVCETYRPPRASHCKTCNNCIDRCDHHCGWVNNCIGRRNYTFFFAFLLSAVLTLCLVICTSAIHLYLLTRNDHIDFGGALSHGVGSAIAFSLSILVMWPMTAILAYHMRLLSLNMTAVEQLRNEARKSREPGVEPPNPYSYGSCWSNVAEVLCQPAGFSWLNARGYVTEDKRRVNPGLGDVGLDTDLERADGHRTADQ